MSFALRQSTAQTIRVGPFVDTAGAVVTSLTIAQADRKWSKNGGAFAQTSDTNNATHDTGGFYSFSVTATDSDTCGPMRLSIQKSGALPYFETFEVLAPAAYDARFVHPIIGQALHYGTLQSGSGSLSAKLAATASASDNFYKGTIIALYRGTGAGQARYIPSYTGASVTAAVDVAWTTTPDNTTGYAILSFGAAASLAEVADAVLDELCTGSLSAYNARPSLRQAIAELVQNGRNVTKSGNNLLTKDVDGTTTIRTRAMAPDATDPTSMSVTA